MTFDAPSIAGFKLVEISGFLLNDTNLSLTNKYIDSNGKPTMVIKNSFAGVVTRTMYVHLLYLRF